MSKSFKYSEIFRSIQGEGEYTGVLTAWIRFWGCNLSCDGFGQENLDDPSTWVLPYKDFDASQLISVDQLPVWETSCDSSYSWSKKYRHLAHNHTAAEIVDIITKTMANKNTNSKGLFLHPYSGIESHMAFTGGEPMMSQPAMIAIIKEMHRRENMPLRITVETNGTRPIKDDLINTIRDFYMTSDFDGLVPDDRGSPEWFWSVSPKLRASGEPWAKAIRPDVVEQYSDASDAGQLKFVVDGSDRTWYEVDKAIEEYRKHDIDWPVWIMPVGGTSESQQSEQTIKIVEETMDRGFNVAARVHSYIFGNKIGT